MKRLVPILGGVPLRGHWIPGGNSFMTEILALTGDLFLLIFDSTTPSTYPLEKERIAFHLKKLVENVKSLNVDSLSRLFYKGNSFFGFFWKGGCTCTCGTPPPPRLRPWDLQNSITSNSSKWALLMPLVEVTVAYKKRPQYG